MTGMKFVIGMTSTTSAGTPEYERGFIDGMQKQLEGSIIAARAAAHWHAMYMKQSFKSKDDAARFGGEIEILEIKLAEREKWVRLTVFEVSEAFGNADTMISEGQLRVYEAIEAKLIELNHG